MKNEAGFATGGTGDPNAILRARARALSRAPQPAARADALLELLEFRLADEAYAVETCHVAGVVPLKDLTPVPCTPPFIAGIVNVRGRLTPVIDIKKFFGLPEKGLTDLHRIVLVQDDDLEFGLLADVVVGVRSIAADTLKPVLPTLTGIAAEYVKGLTAERLILLDLARMMSDPRIIVNEEVEL